MPLPMMEPTTRPRPKVPGLRLLDVDGAIVGCAGGLYEGVVMLFCLGVGGQPECALCGHNRLFVRPLSAALCRHFFVG